MKITFDPTYRLEVVRAEAEARGLQGRLRALAAMREDDGLDPDEAELDAADTLGLSADLDAVIDEALAPLGAREEPTGEVEITSAYAGMPTLKRTGAHAAMTLTPGPFGTVRELAARLATAAAADPDRTAFWLTVGLGGSGGCACGDELPEDAPAGPLFER